MGRSVARRDGQLALATGPFSPQLDCRQQGNCQILVHGFSGASDALLIPAASMAM